MAELNGLLQVLQDAFSGIVGLEAAFVFGSLVRGEARPDSDIDVVLYGTPDAEGAVARAILDLSLVLNRRLDAKWYTRDRFLADAEEGASFLPAALRGPKIWLVGSQNTLPQRQHQAVK